MATFQNRSNSTALRLGIVVGTREDVCTVIIAGTPVEVAYADFFPAPRVDRVAPGSLVAMSTTDPGRIVVVWRWFDAVVQEVSDESVRLWEPAHASVVARPRSGTRRYRAGGRAYLSAGLPGADWWVAGPVVDAAEDADVELMEVEAFLAERGLGFGTA